MEASRPSGPNFRSLIKIILENWMLPYKFFVFFLQYEQIDIVSNFAENKYSKRS